MAGIAAQRTNYGAGDGRHGTVWAMEKGSLDVIGQDWYRAILGIGTWPVLSLGSFAGETYKKNIYIIYICCQQESIL